MAAFHSKFRNDYKQIYALADSYEKRGLSLSRYLDFALAFDANLHFHHSIEDEHIFGVLGERMPEFREGSEHPESHLKIHAGLEHYTAYLRAVKSAPNKYDPSELRARMQAFHDVLFTHLDDEEKSLRRPNMEKYWTLEEVKRLPM